MELINDKRLTSTMKVLRSGSTQLFREKNPKDRTFINSKNCDVSLEHKNREMYAKLIDGLWYWVSGCAECNGEPRDWTTYIECEKHNRCSVCSTNRKDIKEDYAWGGKHGWTCHSCHDAEMLETRRLAFEKLDGEEPDCSFCDEIICPHCGSKIGSDDINESQELDCEVCDGEILLEVDWTASYSTTIKGERITK